MPLKVEMVPTSGYSSDSLGGQKSQAAGVLGTQPRRSYYNSLQDVGGVVVDPKATQPPQNVFDFLNEKLQSQVLEIPDAGVDIKESSKKDMYHAHKSAKQALSLQHFQTEEKIEQT
ncbi:Zinc finger CCCH-type with G patch domain-containing protein [Microtus ochrogaster]|uniref:Zinc finger CCCH-type with G patch domain-containing protein n=1 Tax=Microtus ochrogaster TaxID=79684 RepID=A0A8J6KTQ6_MICOH|nr:Zinc finger CCCH-type with G patch domain-containing protein [Microtus ochrogaster]